MARRAEEPAGADGRAAQSGNLGGLPEIKQRFERDLFLSMDADVPTLNRFIADEVKRWNTFFQESGFKPQ